MMNFDNLEPVESSYTDTVGSGSYTELITATAYTAAALAVENTTDAVIKLAIGPDPGQADIPEYIAPGVAKIIHKAVPKSSRLSCSAVNDDATTGFLVVTLLA